MRIFFFPLTAVDITNVLTLSVFCFFSSNNNKRQFEALKVSALQWSILAFHISLFYNLNIKPLFWLCPLHNCRRHLEPYVPVWCTPWKSGECQNMVYRVSRNSQWKSSMTCWGTPDSSRDGNLPEMLREERAECTPWLHVSLLESPW